MDRRHFLRRTGLLSLCSLPVLAGHARKSSEPAPVPDTRFNVRAFGAKGDGRTSDSEAIRQALQAAAAVHGTVWFPAGTYCCHDILVPPHVTLLADPVWIFRAEPVGAVLQLDDPTASCVLDITGSYGVHIHGLVVNGLRDTPQPVHGIYLNNTEQWSPKEDTLVLDDTKVMNCSGHGLYLKRVWLFILRHSQFMSNGGDGVRLWGWDGFVTDNQFSGNAGNGFGCEHCGATVMFTANRVEWNAGYGLYITGGDDWNVTGNSFDRNHGAGLCVEKGTAVVATGNVFRRCGKDSAELAEGAHSCHVRLEMSNGVTLTGNTFLAGQDDGGHGLFTPQVGMVIKSLRQSVITNNTLYHGYMKEMIIDEGGHEELILRDNVGSPR